MIDFACREFRIEEIVKCSLGISKADLRALYLFMNNCKEWFTTGRAAKKLDLDITTVQRAVKRLTAKNVLNRRQVNLEGGGYEFTYQIKSRKEIKNLIMKNVHDWVSEFDNKLAKW